MAEATSSNLRQKHSSIQTNGARISELPDALLCHILSFLTTNDAVGTSLLSSRWRYVWTCVPSLHFQEKYGGDPRKLCVVREEFVDRVIALHRLPCLKKFYLNLYNDHDPSHVNAWICAAIMSNIEELHLLMNDKVTIELPQILYNFCEKLVVLNLSNLCVTNVLASVCLPSLKVLHIQDLSYLNNDFVKKILYGSPVLEDFELYGLFQESTLYIHSPSLKKLNIGIVTELNSLDVVAPKLEVLELCIPGIVGRRMMNLPSLVEANIYLEEFFVEHQSLISNVKVLRSSLYFFEEYFEPSKYNFGSFSNLTHLDVTPIGDGWLILPTILKCSPNLEVLVVDINSYLVDMGVYEVTFSFRPEDVPQCMLCLQKIELKGFKGSDKEVMKMIEYLLKHSMVLEEMKISIIWAEPDVLFRLLTFPRASSRCQIVLSPPKKEN